MAKYRLKKGDVGEKVAGISKKIKNAFTDAFLEKDETSESGFTLKTSKVEEEVVRGYKAIENDVVAGYKKIEEKFVDSFLEEIESSDSEPEAIEHQSAKDALELSREIKEKHNPNHLHNSD